MFLSETIELILVSVIAVARLTKQFDMYMYLWNTAYWSPLAVKQRVEQAAHDMMAACCPSFISAVVYTMPY